jgi:hypothetical protein
MSGARAAFQRTSRKRNTTDDREVARSSDMGSRETKIPMGDGKAGVNVARGFKTWFSTREAGMTVESTVHVQLTCGQSEKEIKAAAEEAGRLAEELSLEGSEHMGMHLEPLMSGVSPQADAPKGRRSEHPKHRRGR